MISLKTINSTLRRSAADDVMGFKLGLADVEYDPTLAGNLDH